MQNEKTLVEDVRSQAEMLLLAIKAGDPASELKVRVNDILSALAASPAATRGEPSWLELFRSGTPILLHYHGREIAVTKIRPLRPGAILVEAGGMLPVVFADDGTYTGSAPIWLALAPAPESVRGEAVASEVLDAARSAFAEFCFTGEISLREERGLAAAVAAALAHPASAPAPDDLDHAVLAEIQQRADAAMAGEEFEQIDPAPAPAEGEALRQALIDIRELDVLIRETESNTRRVFRNEVYDADEVRKIVDRALQAPPAARSEPEAEMVETDIVAEARRRYDHSTDNHPTIHSNRFPTWGELSAGERKRWIDEARAALTASPKPGTQEGQS
jgi:hypothetical protein